MLTLLRTPQVWGLLLTTLCGSWPSELDSALISPRKLLSVTVPGVLCARWQVQSTCRIYRDTLLELPVFADNDAPMNYPFAKLRSNLEG